MIGQQIDGKYEVTGQLGSGAMGTVYEARHISTGRAVAVKVIQNGLGTDPALVVRFQREARAAGAIESAHIAQVLDAGQDRTTDAPYLVMELLKGEDVDTLVRRMGALRHGLALRIIAQALAGLERAHAAHVVHRDIKPANLFIAQTDAGRHVVKLVDFGIAKVKDELGQSSHALTQTSALLGSPLYMSPEQARASKRVDARADLWSLGVVLYQLLTGKAPHAHAESLTELLLAICTEDARPVQQVAPWVPADVAAIVERAVRLDPSKRFDDAKQMRDAIAAIVPDWSVLTDAMFTPMTAEERAFVAEPSADAASLGVSTGPAAGGGTSAPGTASLPSSAASGERSTPSLEAARATNLEPLPGSAAAGAAGGAGMSASHQSAPAFAKSTGATEAPSQAAGPRARSSFVIPAAVGGVIAIALGLVGLRAMKANDGPTTASSAGLVEQSPSAAPATLSATSASAGTAAATGSVEAPKDVVPSTSAVASASASASAAAGTGKPTPPGTPRVRPPAPAASPPAVAPGVAAAPASAKPAAVVKPAAPSGPASPSIDREFK